MLEVAATTAGRTALAREAQFLLQRCRLHHRLSRSASFLRTVADNGGHKRDPLGSPTKVRPYASIANSKCKPRC
jgi:hypothetical protein